MKHLVLPLFLFLTAWMGSERILGQQPAIPLQGTFAFRDIGGYGAANGKRIKSGKLYRSALLADLTQEDLWILEAFKVSTIIDFRGPLEVNAYPDKVPEGARYIELAAGSEADTPDDWAAMAREMKTKTPEESDDGAETYYKNIAACGKRYKPMFETLLNTHKDSAVIFHCAGGKDRTGIAAALIEYVLGVSYENIHKDYLYSNVARKSYNEEIAQLLYLKYGVPIARARQYGLAKPQFIKACFNQINEQYGSVDKFLKKELDLNAEKMEQLRRLYLE
ncbi:tyrosine-protein phosphatase [Arachidicoccus terrestris]|uniref:tyrosine-protein phosphatase n=1 Tax=Arachidicoccus terrestris TaxID=2875539 RepID=UPI001CC46830|nr:tyrosine-protein phosphatase [Arachidicoccus terrestris]UAY56974.1 tyrosine-protein phosphatase [Arachidicoccus terrestris]